MQISRYENQLLHAVGMILPVARLCFKLRNAGKVVARGRLGVVGYHAPTGPKIQYHETTRRTLAHGYS